MMMTDGLERDGRAARNEEQSEVEDCCRGSDLGPGRFNQRNNEKLAPVRRLQDTHSYTKRIKNWPVLKRVAGSIITRKKQSSTQQH